MAISHLTFSSIKFVKILFEKLNSYDAVNVFRVNCRVPPTRQILATC